MKILLNNKGSALIMALMTVVILLVLGLAVTAMATGTLKTNVADATTNDAYYAASAGVNSALEHLKHEVSGYYAAMAEADSTTYSALYTNFYANINSNASSSFAEPSLNGAATQTSFSVGSYDTALEAGELLVSSTSTTADGTQYIVNGSLTVKRLDLNSGSWFVPNTVIYAGGAIDLGTNRGMTASGADVVAGELRELNASPWYSRFNHSGGTLMINPAAGDALSDVVSYKSYSDPVLPRIDVYITQDGTNYSAGSTSTIYITTAPDVNITLSNNGIAGGIVHGKGNVTISGIGNVYADIYADGNLTVGGGNFYGNLYCRGNLTLSGGNFYSNLKCDGNILVTSAYMVGNAMAKGSITVNGATSIGSMYAKGPVTITSAGNSGGVIYSSTRLNLGSFSASGIFYSAGDVAINGSPSITGALFSKGNVYYSSSSGWMTVSYSQSVVNSTINNAGNSFYFSGSSGSGSTVVDANVVVKQSVSAAGRQ